MSTVLVVDDKEMLRDSVGVTLQRAGFAVIAAPDGAAALELAARRRPDAIVTDLRMPGLTGIELIERVRAIDQDLPIVLMTAFGTIDTAVQAMKLGAYDYITKPFEGDELLVAVKRALEHRRLKRENAVLRLAAQDAAPVPSPVPGTPGAPGIPGTPGAPGAPGALGARGAAGAPSTLPGLDRVIGESPAIRDIKSRLPDIAASQGTVLITGESGTGKEVIARAIHELSARAAEPFLAVNCAAMSESLMESELFGHERGSFTGADRLRQGRFELAHNGTLLLDEVSEVRPHIQAKLLRVLQERAFERVGSSTTISIDVRVIATTNRDLPNEAARGEFRQDLFYRLNVLPISLPPLRERSQDVPLLAPHFVRTICAREGKPAKRLSDAALDLLTAYAWPGNVRELQNLCERAVVLCQKDEIPADLIRGWLGLAMPMTRPATPTAANGSALSPVFPGGGVAATDTSPLRWVREPRQLSDIEREVIVETLKRFDGHRLKTAKALGIGVRTLGLKLKKWKEQHLVADHL